MGLELITEADKILDACGRFQAPPGFKFVDLPRALGTKVVVTAGEGTPGSTPFTVRLENKAKTLFLCDGIGMDAGSFRVKWPTGRYLQQNPMAPVTPGTLLGLGANQLAFNAEQPVEAGGRFVVEMTSQFIGTLNLVFWGRLRYLLKDSGSNGIGQSLSCVVGYPSAAQSIAGQNYPIQMMDDPREDLAQRPRYWCGPNGNILAPEWMLGNQCTDETPAGYRDDPYTFFSAPIVVPTFSRKYSNAVVIPGNYDVVIRRIRPIITWDPGVTGTPVFGLRLPNGYSYTGGDMVPITDTSTGRPLFQWLTVFPTLWVRAGDRLILDVADFGSSGVGNITTQFEFEGVKRRKI